MSARSCVVAALLIGILCSLALSSTALPYAPPSAPVHPFRNASLPIADRVSNLISLLTLAEKLSWLHEISPAVPRLNISFFEFGQECLHGLVNRRSDLSRDGVATAFPQSLGLAASFNLSVFSVMGRVISDEARAKRNGHLRSGQQDKSYLVCWTPVVNIMKDPRWGRAAETYGEAPLLTFALTSALLAALHADDERQIKIAPVLKHFTVYDGPEGGRYGFNALVSDRDLHDTFNYVYRNLIQEKPSHVRGLMASYSSLNGVPVACDFDLLTKQTRYDWGWTSGHVVSDCDAVTGIYEAHHYTADIVDAAALSLVSGMDINCGNGFDYLSDAIKRGLISESDIDSTLQHTLDAQFRLGFYDEFGNGPWDDISPEVVDSAEHRKAALDIALQVMLLLQNNGSILPLRPSEGRLQRIAVIGPTANDTFEYDQCTLGNGGSCLLSHIYHAYTTYLVQPLQGITGWLSERGYGDVQVRYAKGCSRYGNDQSGFAEAVTAANGSDLVVYIGGLDYYIEEEDTDRGSLQLPAIQQQLLTALAATAVPIVSVMIHGSAISDDVLVATSAAVLSASYPGQSAGLAIAQVLFGDYNPSARLPYTTYRDTSQLPAISDYRMADAPGRTYAFLSATPRYYFGDGLSYTRWSFSQLSVAQAADGSLTLQVTVHNHGDMDGSEVVQVYAAYDAQFAGLQLPPALSVPRRMLIAFDKVFVAAHWRITVSLSIPVQRLTAFGRWLQHDGLRNASGSRERRDSLPPRSKATLSHEQVAAEIARMRLKRQELEQRGPAPAAAAPTVVTLPVWISAGGMQPTPQRIASEDVLVMSINVTAAIDDISMPAVEQRGDAFRPQTAAG